MITSFVTGNVGKEPELKETRSGKKMCTFSVASNQKRGDEQETTWVDCVAFEELAETLAEELHKGVRVVVHGPLTLERYKKRDGTEGVSLRMMVNDIGTSIRPKQAQQSKQSKQSVEDEPW